MTRRERLEAKLAKREEWAGKAGARSEAAFSRSHAVSDSIPMGQPILVGHHSERRHRRDIDRIHNGMTKGCEEAKLAEHHESKAAGIEHALENSVFSDDPDAIEALEARIAAREAGCARMTALNKAWKKATGTVPERALALRNAGAMTEKEALSAVEVMAPGYSFVKSPFSLTGERAAIRKDRERIAEIKKRAVRAAKAEADGGVSIVIGSLDWTTVTFAEKPARDVLDALREAGFRWGAGSWVGAASKLPEAVRSLAANSAAGAADGASV